MGAWGALWMLVALKKPSVGGVIIALFSWLAVPVAFVGEAMMAMSTQAEPTRAVQ